MDEPFLKQDRTKEVPHSHTRTVNSNYTAILQCAVSCIRLFLVGSTYALGVFTLPVENSVSPSDALDGVWQSSMGLVHFLSAAISIACAFLLSDGVSTSASHVRFVDILAAVSFVTFSVSAYAISIPSPLLLVASVSMFAVPFATRKSLSLLSVIAFWSRSTLCDGIHDVLLFC